jgi:prophage antirepressor-like protein
MKPARSLFHPKIVQHVCDSHVKRWDTRHKLFEAPDRGHVCRYIGPSRQNSSSESISVSESGCWMPTLQSGNPIANAVKDAITGYSVPIHSYVILLQHVQVFRCLSGAV